MPELVRASEPRRSLDRAYPKPLREAEAKLIAKRREVLGSRWYTPGTTKADGSGVPPDSVGLALSGGGIRSATFALGLLQALARHGLLPRVDFLSTVSGGGYIGSFLGALIQRDPEAGAVGTSLRPVPGVLRAARQLEDSRSWPLRWLRESGRYLSPNGAGDERLAAAVFLRNWVAIQAVLGTTLLAALAALQLLRAVAAWAAPDSPVARGLLGPGLWWSPWLLVGPGVLAFLGVPLGWAYWLTQRDGATARRWALENVMPVAGTVVVAFAAAAAAWLDPGRRIALATLSFLATAALATWGESCSPAVGRELKEEKTLWQRNRLSRRFSTALWVGFLATALGLVDSLGQTLYWRWASPASFAATGLLTLAGLSPAVVWARRLAAVLKPGGQGPSLGLNAVVAILATAVAGTYVVLASALVHSLSWRMEAGRPVQPSLAAAATLLGVSFGLCVLLAPALKFINLSSHQALYAARLVRAYLGASNARRREDAKARSVGDPVRGDEIDLARYAPHEHGGPIHLINVTLNETVRGESQIQYRDRKGLALAVGPAGLSAGVSHHALWADDARRDRVRPVYANEQEQARSEFHLFAGDGDSAAGATPFAGQATRVEALPLGTWVSISGAAFTTGLGSRTSLALSLLLGLLNVRLGYWWDSGVDPDRRRARVRPRGLARVGDLLGRLFPVQSHLLQELLARFHGPNRRRWYLSDGGHFENTGCYELIRRRVPLIVLSDAGQDPRLELEDLANLVRKVRTDFGAEVRFLDAQEIEERLPASVRPFIGSLEEMAPAEAGDRGRRSRVGALLAEIEYHDGAARPAARSMLLVAKPRIAGGEPADVRHYHASHPAFPHEPTTDQYFDEAQWESYRTLGDHIGDRLFADGTLWGQLSAASGAGRGEAHPVASLVTAAAG